VSDDPGMGPWISVVAAAAVAATSRIAAISLAVSSWVDLGGEVFAVDHLVDGHQGDAEPIAADASSAARNQNCGTLLERHFWDACAGILRRAILSAPSCRARVVAGVREIRRLWLVEIRLGVSASPRRISGAR
jgi:hypothetical protein